MFMSCVCIPVKMKRNHSKKTRNLKLMNESGFANSAAVQFFLCNLVDGLIIMQEGGRGELFRSFVEMVCHNFCFSVVDATRSERWIAESCGSIAAMNCKKEDSTLSLHEIFSIISL